MQRRDVLKLSTATVIVGSGVLSSNRSDAVVMPVLSHFWKFAEKIAASVAANQINDYIKNRAKNHQGAVEATNSHMRQGGFTDFSIARVYEQRRKFFYAAGTGQSNLNICVPFFGYTQSDRAITMIEGPTVIALGHAAEKLSSEGLTYKEIGASLLPTELVTRSSGGFQSGYKTRDEYKTDVGSLYVDYRATGSSPDKRSGTGTVEIVATGKQGGNFYKDVFNINYNA